MLGGVCWRDWDRGWLGRLWVGSGVGGKGMEETGKLRVVEWCLVVSGVGCGCMFVCVLISVVIVKGGGAFDNTMWVVNVVLKFGSSSLQSDDDAPKPPNTPGFTGAPNHFLLEGEDLWCGVLFDVVGDLFASDVCGDLAGDELDLEGLFAWSTVGGWVSSGVVGDCGP